MAITWVRPLTGELAGGYFPVHVTSDFVGPLPSDAVWDVRLLGGSDLDQLMIHDVIPTLTTTLNIQLGLSTGLDTIPAPNPKVEIGSVVRLAILLTSPTSGLIDDDTQDQVYDPIQGGLRELALRVFQLQSTQGTSDQLEVIQAAVAPTIPGLGSLGNIGQLLSAPPLGFVRRILIEPDRTGEGDLDFQLFGLNVAAFGLAWDVVSIPEGYGIQQGAPDYWSRQIVKLGLVHTDFESHDFISNVAQFNYGNTYWMFQPQLPTRVLYWIAPGVVLRFYWITG